MKTKNKRRTARTSYSHGNVTLSRTFPQAKSVCIAGSFNGWQPGATPMVQVGPHQWAAELELPAGTYEYRLIVDGQWMDDPDCPERTPNPFGEENCLLRLQ
jgi:1,4-alpha-glucan branching enzyme